MLRASACCAARSSAARASPGSSVLPAMAAPSRWRARPAGHHRQAHFTDSPITDLVTDLGRPRSSDRGPGEDNGTMTTPDVFEFSLQVRYMEVDAQSVVFNAWYLTYFDEAFAAFMAARGLPYEKMIEAGFDVPLVHTDIDWQGGGGWAGPGPGGGPPPPRCPRASQPRRDGVPTCTARTVYVVIATDGSGKRPIPPVLAEALGP